MRQISLIFTQSCNAMCIVVQQRDTASKTATFINGYSSILLPNLVRFDENDSERLASLERSCCVARLAWSTHSVGTSNINDRLVLSTRQTDVRRPASRFSIEILIECTYQWIHVRLILLSLPSVLSSVVTAAVTRTYSRVFATYYVISNVLIIAQ